MKRRTADASTIAPTPERLRHGRVTRTRRGDTVLDSDGAASIPWLAHSMLDRMHAAGEITDAMRLAGDEFHRLFVLAGHSRLRAADYSADRVSGGRADSDGIRSERARRRVIAIMAALGGQGSIVGSAAWFVLGEQMTIAEWARREGWSGRPLNHHAARGRVIAMLDVLARHLTRD